MDFDDLFGKNPAQLDRRRFLELTAVAGVAATEILRPGNAHALELPRGTPWQGGVNALRKSAAEDGTEFAARFVGTRAEGSWLSTTKGDAMQVGETNSDIARQLVELADKSEIEKGVALYHTHPDATARAGYAGNPEILRRQDVVNMLLMPFQDDATALQPHVLKKYLELAGIKPGPIETGIVTSQGRWTMTEINWTDPRTQSTYPQDFAAHTQREKVFAETKAAIVRLLAANPAIADEVYDQQLGKNWGGVVDTAEKRIDLVAHAFLRREVSLDASPRFTVLLNSARDQNFIAAVNEARQISVPNATFQYMQVVLTEMMSGRANFAQASQFMARVYRRLIGFELTWTPHT